MRLLIGIPAMDQVQTPFMTDYVALTDHLVRTHPDWEIARCVVQGTILSYSRQALADQALRGGFDAIFWLDTDMRFPKDTVDRLLAHDHPFVGAVAVRRRPPYTLIAWPQEPLQTKLLDGTPGTMLVERMGFGIVLTKLAVFRQVARPHFVSTDRELSTIGEDFILCERWRQVGGNILVDLDLSRQVRHVGTTEYSVEDLRDE